MKETKEFEGRTLDAAIREACAYYGLAREKLEIEILNDAKTGIFGLVGAKKARVRAVRAQLEDLFSDAPCSAGESGARAGTMGDAPPSCAEQADREQKVLPAKGGAGGSGKGTKTAPLADETLVPESGRTPASGSGKSSGSAQSEHARADRPRLRKAPPDASLPPGGTATPARNGNATASAPCGTARLAGRPEQLREEMPELCLESCDQEKVVREVRAALERLILPIAEASRFEITLRPGKIVVLVDSGDASGLLVGRDGQTLAAVQYLLSRIVARRLGGSVRIQLDTGNYRERQDERLRALALALAERARTLRRPQATRPLSAYQRRIVHLALEGDESVQTTSKGEGAQRRVIIQARRKKTPASSDPACADAAAIRESAENPGPVEEHPSSAG